MPRIKLVRVHTTKYGSYYNRIAAKASQDISDWEDVTHEELKFLKSPDGKRTLINQKEGFEDYIIVEKVEKSISSNKLKSIQSLIQKAKDEQEKIKEEKKQRAMLEQQKKEEQIKKAEERKIEEAKRLLAKNGMKVLE